MNIAFLGTGILGRPMAERLLTAGHKLWVYNRTKAKAMGLIKQGAEFCAKSKEAIAHADVIILVLSDANAIEEVLFQDERALKGKTVIQMGTIASAQSWYLLKRVNHLQGQYFECPVLGSRAEAAAARLILMVGASQEQFNHYKEFLMCFGPQPRLIGPVGTAATLKLALNQLIAAHATGFSLSLGLIQNSGIEVDQFMSILGESALVAPMYTKKLPQWLSHDYKDPNFSLKHLIKDVDLILSEAGEKRMNTKVLVAIREVLGKCAKDGMAELDYTAVFETINKQ